MQFTITAATSEDIPLLSELHGACFPRQWMPAEFMGFFDHEGCMAAVAYLQESEDMNSVQYGSATVVAPALSGEQSEQPIAEVSRPEQGQQKIHPIGFIFGWVVVGEYELLAIGVREEFRGRGVGDALLQYALAEAAKRGATTYHLEFELGNVAAEKLYAKHGFTIISRRKNYYQYPDGTLKDALVMRRVTG